MYGLWTGGSMHLCGYNAATEECHADDYFVSLALEIMLPALFAGLVVTALTIGAGILYFSCLNFKCCKACFWYGAARFIIKGKFLKKRWHWLYTILFLRGRLYRALFVMLAVLNIIFLIVILGIEIKVETATDTFRSRTNAFAMTEADVLDRAVTAVMALPEASGFGNGTMNVLQQTKDKISDFRSQASNINKIKDVELAKFIPEIFFIILLLSLCFAGVLVVLLGNKMLIVVFGVSLVVVFVPAYVYFSSSVALEVLYQDICDDGDIALRGGNSALKYGIVQCNGTSMMDLRSNLTGIYKSVEVKACIQAQLLCAQPGVICPAAACALQNISMLIENTTITDSLPCGSPNCTRTCNAGEVNCYSQTMSLPLCTAQCLNPSLKALANRARTGERDAIIFGMYYSLVFLPLANCDFVPQYVRYIHRPVCQDMMKIGVSAVFMLIVCLLLMLQFFLLVAIHMSLHKKEKTMFEMAYRPPEEPKA